MARGLDMSGLMLTYMFTVTARKQTSGELERVRSSGQMTIQRSSSLSSAPPVLLERSSVCQSDEHVALRCVSSFVLAT